MFNQYRMYFTKNIRKYIEQNLYQLFPDEEIFLQLRGISTGDCERWKNSPIDYLSDKEALAIGLYYSLGKEASNHSDQLFTQVMAYFDHCLNSTKCSKIKHLAKIATGVVLFEKALHSQKQSQKKYLSLAKYYLSDALEDKPMKEESNYTQKEMLYIYLTLVEVSMGNLQVAIKNLTKASKASENPLPIWRMLASIYRKLGMDNVSHYFNLKIDRYRQSSY